MAKATKRSRSGRRLKRKSAAWFPLRRPALLAALGLAGWAPAGAADFPPTLDLSDLDGTNGFRLNGVAADDRSGYAVSSVGDVNGDGLADLLIGGPHAPNRPGPPNGSKSGASYVVFGRNTGQTGPFPASLNLSGLDGTNGFRLNGVPAYDHHDRSGFAVSSAGDVNGDGLADLLIGAPDADPNGRFSGASYVVFGRNTGQTGPFPASLNLSDLDGTNGFRLDGEDPGRHGDPELDWDCQFHRDPHQAPPPHPAPLAAILDRPHGSERMAVRPDHAHRPWIASQTGVPAPVRTAQLLPRPLRRTFRVVKPRCLSYS